MATQDIAAALQRAQLVFQRRPEAGLHDDAPAAVRWDGGTRMVCSHANGKQALTDMPSEFGGSGDQVTPGWLLRAGLASCTATSIAMAAATQKIELTALEVLVSSRSDARGMLGMTNADGTTVYAGPGDMQMRVQISAPGVAPERLRALVEEAHHRAPIFCAVHDPVPVALVVEVGGN
jgi:uncharacterized OsmC-like protein